MAGGVSMRANTRSAAATPCWTLAYTSDSVLTGEMVDSSAAMNSTNCWGAIAPLVISRPPNHSIATATSTMVYSLTGRAAAETRRSRTKAR